MIHTTAAAAAAALSQVTAKPFDPYASSQNFYSFFSWQPLERLLLTLTPKFYDENSKINVHRTIFSQTLGLGKSFHNY
jgi:hypothetical protein